MENIQYYPHLCACGCGGQIEIKKHHKYYGIPNILKGHREPPNKLDRNLFPICKSEKCNNKVKTITSKYCSQKCYLIDNNPMYNKNISDKISKLKKGKKLTEEHRNKIRISNKKIIDKKGVFKKGQVPWNKNKNWDIETRQKMSKSHIGIQLGEKNPSWQNGKSFLPYSPEFNKEKKQQVLERDNYTCQCPECLIENPKKLHIHHIDYDKKNNNPENLITLCNSCHSKTNFNRQYWVNFYQNIMEIKINVI